MTGSWTLLVLALGVCLSACADHAVRQTGTKVEDGSEYPTGGGGGRTDGGSGPSCVELDKDASFDAMVDRLESQGLVHGRAIALGLLVRAGRLDTGMAQCP
ncbi:hypothetical protein BON30_31135 [Cystobacter ferrugineus]|uniref:Lipoprotein n=1 Tax=Cystobacter ferrugineus TaxID=83449 RepID=A0A1L9B3U4_9BACT|nr:hypothetical protein BON30_31135 [Cystobacter ferrugineus]